MNEVKRPKKPLIYYYVIVLLVLLLFNFLAMPWLAGRQIQEVDYSTFIEMAEDKEIGRWRFRSRKTEFFSRTGRIQGFMRAEWWEIRI